MRLQELLHVRQYSGGLCLRSGRALRAQALYLTQLLLHPDSLTRCELRAISRENALLTGLIRPQRADDLKAIMILLQRSRIASTFRHSRRGKEQCSCRMNYNS